MSAAVGRDGQLKNTEGEWKFFECFILKTLFLVLEGESCTQKSYSAKYQQGRARLDQEVKPLNSSVDDNIFAHGALLRQRSSVVTIHSSS